MLHYYCDGWMLHLFQIVNGGCNMGFKIISGYVFILSFIFLSGNRQNELMETKVSILPRESCLREFPGIDTTRMCANNKQQKQPGGYVSNSSFNDCIS